jgi:hypothetical protein
VQTDPGIEFTGCAVPRSLIISSFLQHSGNKLGIGTCDRHPKLTNLASRIDRETCREVEDSRPR